MITRFLTVATLSTAVALGGCASFPTPAQIATTVSGIEQQVQNDANLACGFIPTIATIAAFIPGVGIAAADAATIAESICTAIAQAPPVTTSSARLKSLQSGVAVKVATVNVPGVGPVTIAGQYTK